MRRRNGIERLLALYDVVEQTRSLELRIAASAVAEVEHAQSREVDAVRAHCEAQRTAFATGDSAARMIVMIGRDASDRCLATLARLHSEREQYREAAEIVHGESRLMKERIERVAERKRVSSQTDEARRTQADSDERYISRQRGNSSQVNQSATVSDGMKAS